MPIGSIISQPGIAGTPTVLPAYEAIVFRISATRSDGQPVPPVVFCDVYLNDVFYKSIPATQYALLNPGNTEWQFDISDVCQEYLRRDNPVNGGSVLIRGEKQVAIVYCKFRSSGYDANGFITVEGVDPVQGTGLNAPKEGSGTVSENFLVINSAIQNEDNPDFLTHLTYQRRSPNFDPAAYPLSHRPARYHVSKNASDYYPFLYLGATPLAKICVRYKLKGSGSYIETCYNMPVTCDSAVTAVDPTVSSNGDASIAFTSTGSAAQWEYRVDGLSWKTVPSNPFPLTFTNLLIYIITEITGEPVVTSDGQIIIPEEVTIYDTNHSIEIRPRCSNGVYGTSGSADINIPSAAVCNPPELFELNDVDYNASEVLLNITLPAGKSDFQLEWRFDYGGGVLTPAVVQDHTLAGSPFHWSVPAGYNNGTFRLRIRTNCGADLSPFSESLPVPYSIPVVSQSVTVTAHNADSGAYQVSANSPTTFVDPVTIHGYLVADNIQGQVGTFNYNIFIPAGQTTGVSAIPYAPPGGKVIKNVVTDVTPNPTADGTTITTTTLLG